MGFIAKLQAAVARVRAYQERLNKGELSDIPAPNGWDEEVAAGARLEHKVNNPQRWYPGCKGWVTHYDRDTCWREGSNVAIEVGWAIA